MHERFNPCRICEGEVYPRSALIAQQIIGDLVDVPIQSRLRCHPACTAASDMHLGADLQQQAPAEFGKSRTPKRGELVAQTSLPNGFHSEVQPL